MGMKVFTSLSASRLEEVTDTSKQECSGSDSDSDSDSASDSGLSSARHKRMMGGPDFWTSLNV